MKNYLGRILKDMEVLSMSEYVVQAKSCIKTFLPIEERTDENISNLHYEVTGRYL